MITGVYVDRGLVDSGLFTDSSVTIGGEVFRVLILPEEVLPEVTSYTLQVGVVEHLLNDVIRRLNHSCDPSIRLSIEDGYVVAYAIRELSAGDELTFNYMSMDLKQAQGGMACHCGAINCKKVLNGFDGLTLEEQQELFPLLGGVVREAYINRVLSECHAILDDGTVETCNGHIALGTCGCCTFNQGNWIGLVAGESAYLAAKGDSTGWVPKEGHNGITCTRNPFKCDNKPLDCKMYPFFPAGVAEVDGTYVVDIIAGDEKCAAGQELMTELKGIVIDSGDGTGFRSHMYRVAMAGVRLHINGLSGWMADTAAKYVGYNKGYLVTIDKTEV